MRNKVGYLLLIASLGAGSALAQVERLPGVIDRGQPRIDFEQKLFEESTKPSALDDLRKKPALESFSQQVVLDELKSLSIEGNTKISDAVLYKAVASYIGAPLTKRSLANLKYDITNEYYKRGYILVRIVTPPQTIEDGDLRVEIHEATIGEVRLENKSRLRDSVVNRIGSRVAKGKVFQERVAETVVTDLDDLTNIESSITLKAGDEFKTTDVIVAVTDAKEDRQRISYDNYGSELTGRNVFSGQVQKSNLFGFGETLNGSVRKSNGNLLSTNIGFSVPVLWQNLTLSGYYVHSDNEIGDRLASLNSEGESDIVNFALSTNLLNTRNNKISLRTGFEARNHESTIGPLSVTDTKDSIRQAFLEASWISKGSKHFSYISGEIRRGVDIFGQSDTERPTFAEGGFASRAGGNPEAWIFSPSLLLQYGIVPRGSIRVSARGQIASDALLSSDLFVLGGYGSVRGFEPAFSTGEDGFSYSVEYQHSFYLNPEWVLSVGPFFDAGAVYNDLDVGLHDTHLYSTGIGAEVNTRVFNQQTTRFRFDYAYPLGSYIDADNEQDDHRFYFRLSQDF